jgi:diguanylate cyclase (GGDEF)-like protein/PAS domain S-box-containing protein
MAYVNDAYLAIHGLTREDAAEGWLALVREDIREQVRKEWMRLVGTAEPVSAVRRLHRADGTDVLVSMRTRPVLMDGRVVGHVGTVSDITERTRAERALRTLGAIFDSTTDFVVQLDSKGRLTYMNPAARRRTGVALNAPIEHLTMADFNPPQALGRLMSEIVPTAVANGVWVGESQVWDAERREFPVSHMVIAHRDKHGKVEYFSALMRDISAAKATEQALQESEARLRTVADALPMRVAYIDAEERYRFNNLAYERGFGLSREQIQGRSVRELLGEAAYRSAEAHIRAALSGKAVTFQSEMTSGDSYVCYEAHYIPQFAADGSTVLGFHAVVGDITRQKLEEKRLVELARVDTLTGVINRAGFGLRLSEVMGRCRSTGALMALMYLDIDRFKQINDRFGHSVGDALLRAFAARLSQTLRISDTVARLGGDEFTVIMESVPRPEVAGTVAAKIVQAMSTPFVIEQQTISVTTSIGLAFFQGGSMTAESLIKQADEMLYQAKGAGRNNVQAAPVALRVVEGGQA